MLVATQVITRFFNNPVRWAPIAGKVQPHLLAFMASQTPQYPIAIPLSNDTYDCGCGFGGGV